MRFVPILWDQLSYCIDEKDWSKTGRGLLFEVKTYLAKPGRVNVSLIIGPGDQAFRKALYEAASARSDMFVGLVKPMGVKWATIFSRDLLTAEQAATMSAEGQANNLRQSWSHFQDDALRKLTDVVLEMDLTIKRAMTSGYSSDKNAIPAGEGIGTGPETL